MREDYCSGRGHSGDCDPPPPLEVVGRSYLPRRAAAVGSLLVIAFVLVSKGSSAEAGVYRAQLASYHSEDDARVGWSKLKGSHPDLLGDLAPSIERADLGPKRGVFFRLQVGAFEDSAEADSFCARLRSNGLDCVVVYASDETLNSTEPENGPIVDESSPAPTTEDQPNESDVEAHNKMGEETKAPDPHPPMREEGVPTVSTYESGLTPWVSETTAEVREFTEGSEGTAMVSEEFMLPDISPRQVPTSENTPTEPAGYVRFLGGLTFVPNTDGLVGGGAGFNVTPAFQIVCEVGRFRDVLSRTDSASMTEGGVEINPSVSALYGMGGLRFLVPTSRYGRPYATLSAGIARMQDETTFKLSDGKDITTDLRVIGWLPLVPPTHYESLISAGCGVNWETKRGLSFDVGYRYLRIFTVEPIEVGAAYFAVGYVFKKSMGN